MMPYESIIYLLMTNFIKIWLQSRCVSAGWGDGERGRGGEKK